MGKTEWYFIGLAVGLVAAALMGLVIGRATTLKWQAEVIEHGCGAYDEKTGEWEWNSQINPQN